VQAFVESLEHALARGAKSTGEKLQEVVPRMPIILLHLIRRDLVQKCNDSGIKRC
jgi:hypothetical protein